MNNNMDDLIKAKEDIEDYILGLNDEISTLSLAIAVEAIDKSLKTSDKYEIKFISYTGKYPNLCSGDLTLNVNGKIMEFGYNKPYPCFWITGGGCSFKEGNVSKGKWLINMSKLPDELQNYANELEIIINDNIPYGCCGGCL